MLSGGCIKDGTGRSQATAVTEAVTSWACGCKVVSACTDTTSSMTGNKKGAVVLLEQDLGMVLVYLACRDHELETLPKHLFEQLVENSSSPDLGTLCSNFKKKWQSMDHTNYRTTVEDPDQNVLTNEMAKKIVDFCTRILQVASHLHLLKCTLMNFF